MCIYNSKSNKRGYKSVDTDIGRGSERHREVDIMQIQYAYA